MRQSKTIASYTVALPNDSSVRFLSLDDVIRIHERMLEEFGGSSGIRDPGLLESAVYRPQSGYYENLAEMAAALLHSLLMNHAFVDDNKRVAVAAADVFLRFNGQSLKISANEAEVFLIERIKASDGQLLPFTEWISRHMDPL